MSTLSLAEQIRTMVAADKVNLPIHAKVSAQILAKNLDDGLDGETLQRLIAQDPALVCILFRAANSSFYQGLQKTATIGEAITRLGLEETRQLICDSCHTATGTDEGLLTPRYLDDLWQHTFGCALGSQWLAQRCGFGALSEQAYLAGLMHDIGKLFLLATLEGIAGSTAGTGLSDNLVMEVLETMHVEQGLRLVAEWNLPEIYARTIDTHHEENLDTQETVIALVRLANKGCHKIGLGWTQDPDLVLPTTAEAQYLGINEITLAEFEIMLEDRFHDGTTLNLPFAMPA